MEQLFEKIVQHFDKQFDSLKIHVDKRFKQLDRKLETFRKKLYNAGRRKIEIIPIKKISQLKPFDSWKENSKPNKALNTVFSQYGPDQDYSNASKNLCERFPEGLDDFVINHFNTQQTANINLVGTRTYIFTKDGWLLKDAEFLNKLCDDIWEKYNDEYEIFFENQNGWESTYEKILEQNQDRKPLTKRLLRQYLNTVSKLAKVNRKLF